MYTPKMSGVRIRLPEYPFDTEILSANEEGVKEDITYDKGLLSLQQNNDVIVMPYKAQLISVTYTEDESLLNPKIVTGSGQNISISTDNMGKFKRSSWDFQKEYRYKVNILPFTLKELETMLNTGIDRIVNKLRDHTLHFTHIDLHLNEELFKDMEILIGPKISEAQKIIVDSLVEKYNSNANIQSSSLKIK